MGSTASKLASYRRELWLAAASVMAVRVAVAAAAVGSISFVLVAWLLGPLTPFVWLCIGWSLVFAMVAAAVAWSLQPLRRLRGHGALGLVAAAEPSLLSPLQSAYELQDEEAFSRELIIAQRLGLLRSLERSPVRKFIPWRWLGQPALAATLVMAAAAWWSLGFDRPAAGRYALLHTDPGMIEGARVSQVVASTRARLRFPDYMHRPDRWAEDANRLLVPRGTAVEYAIVPIADAARIVLELPGRHVEATRAGDDFIASFVTDSDGPFEIYVESARGERRVDHQARSIRVLPDDPPRVEMVEPSQDLTAEEKQDIPIRYSATDDYGIHELTLIIKLPNGEHLRRSLWTTSDAQQMERAGEVALRLEEFSLAPADAVTVWLEAKDGNLVDGPGVGRSAMRTLTLASDITRRRDGIVELEKILDSLLALLAVRLEQPLPEALSAARLRRNGSALAHRQLLGLLSNLGEHPGPRTIPLLLDMKRRLERKYEREDRVYREGSRLAVRKRYDQLMVAELERDSLLVADLISEARLDDAAEIAREMRHLRSEIASMISELRRGQTPELQRALMAALDRADRRMQALQQRLLEAMRYVPGEFVNRQSRQAGESTDALRSVREALAKGDLDAAEDALRRLDQMIEAMAQALAQSEESLVEARFGPRERALMEAMDTIRDLEIEQQRMADKAGRVGDKAIERASKQNEAFGSEARQQLEKIAEEVSELLGGLNDKALGPYETGLRGRAQERAGDFQEALKAGDLAEALAMADRLTEAAGQLAKDLELSAMMFRGRGGQTAEAAAQAREAAARAQDLQRAAKESVPDIEGSLTEREREQLGRQAADQQGVQEATHKLARRLRDEVGGVPVSEQTAEQLESIEQPMRRAAEALNGGNPLEAHKQQEAAADQLRRLRQQMESQSRGSSGRDGRERGSSTRRDSERVEIPLARSKADELAWRRRVLDSMNGKPPRGYQQAVDDYYERLLR